MPPPTTWRTNRMTANVVQGPRHFAGKPLVPQPQEDSSSSEFETESEDEEQKEKALLEAQRKLVPRPAPLPPKASSFPKPALAQKKSQPDVNEDEFETEDEGGDEEGSGSGSGSGSEESSEEEEEESSEEELAPRKLIRPVYIPKAMRNKGAPIKTPDEIAAEEAARKADVAKALVQEHIEKVAEERAARKKQWDDDGETGDNLEDIDDTDDKDPEAEYLAWKLRELMRVKRARAEIEEAEAEREELERRRNLTAEEREAEDRERMAEQEKERGEKGEMQFMQKYFHKGAFFQEELKELGVDKRDIMGARFEDQVANKEVLPEYMRIRDMTKLGKKGRTRYKDMKTEDTGRWADYQVGVMGRRDDRSHDDYHVDERFRDDGYRSRRDHDGATGANASQLGERKRGGEEHGRDGKRPRYDER